MAPPPLLISDYCPRCGGEINVGRDAKGERVSSVTVSPMPKLRRVPGVVLPVILRGVVLKVSG